MRALGGVLAFLLWLGGWAAERRRSAARRSAAPAEPRRRALRAALGVVSALAVTLLGVGVTSMVDDARSRREEASANRRQLEQILTQASLVGVDFRGYDLTEQALIDRDMSDALLDEVPLARATLRGVTADGASFHGADLRSATMRSSSFAGADLGRVRLTNAVVAQVDLTDADLTSLDMAGATAVDVDLSRSTADRVQARSLLMAGASWTDSSWTDADLAGSVLLGIDFDGAVLDRADLSGAQLLPPFAESARPLDPAVLDLTESDVAEAFGVSLADFGRLLDRAGLTVTSLADVRPSEFVRALMAASLDIDVSLHGLDVADVIRITGVGAAEFTAQPLFEGTSLREADLTDLDLLGQTVSSTDLTGAVVQGADLAGATIDGSSLAGVDLGSARVDGLRLTDVGAQSSTWSGRTYTDVVLARVNLDYADLRATRFVDSSFTAVSLRGADLRGADLSALTAADLDLADSCFDTDTMLPAGARRPTEATCYDRPPVPRRSTNEPAEPQPPEQNPIGSVPCGRQTCYGLQVFDTYANGRDEGLYIRSCHGVKAECPRPLALAALGDVVWAYCKTDDGLDVEGNTTWVRVRWHIVPDAVPADGRVAAADTGYSSPTAGGRGWASTRYLRDERTIDRLPLCTEE